MVKSMSLQTGERKEPKKEPGQGASGRRPGGNPEEVDSAPVTLYLTRHGRTTANVMHLMQGWSDFPLTRQGREDVRTFGRGLLGIRFHSAYCGNLTRHYDTAREALDNSGNGDVQIEVIPDLREDNFGSFEGREEDEIIPLVARTLGLATWQEAAERYGRHVTEHMQDAFHRMDLEEDPYRAGLADEDRAETTAQVQGRMLSAVTGIARTAASQGGGNVLVVSSGMCLQQLLLVLLDEEVDIPGMDNTATTRLVYENGIFSLDGPVSSMDYYRRGADLG